VKEQFGIIMGKNNSYQKIYLKPLQCMSVAFPALLAMNNAQYAINCMKPFIAW